MYNTNSQVKLKTAILNAYIIIKGSVTVTSIAAADACANNTNKKIIFKFCASFNDGIRELNRRWVNNIKDTDVVISMFNFLE